MKRDQLDIQEPCGEDWGEMIGGEQSRHCEHCEKSVHNVSGMTQQSAASFLADSGDSGVCVVYQFGRDEQILFADGPIHERAVPMGQLTGAKRLVAAALIAVPLLAAGCDTGSSCDNTTDTFVPLTLILEQEQALVDALGDLFAEQSIMMGAVSAPVMGGPEPLEIVEVPRVDVAPLPSPPPDHVIQNGLDTQLNEVEIPVRHMMGKIAPTRLEPSDEIHEYIE